MDLILIYDSWSTAYKHILLIVNYIAKQNVIFLFIYQSNIEIKFFYLRENKFHIFKPNILFSNLKAWLVQQLFFVPKGNSKCIKTEFINHFQHIYYYLFFQNYLSINFTLNTLIDQMLLDNRKNVLDQFKLARTSNMADGELAKIITYCVLKNQKECAERSNQFLLLEYGKLVVYCIIIFWKQEDLENKQKQSLSQSQSQSQR